MNINPANCKPGEHVWTNESQWLCDCSKTRRDAPSAKVFAVRKEFEYHKLNTVGLAEVDCVRAAFSALLDVIDAAVPNSREKSLTITDLQSAASWAIRGVATKAENQA